MSLPCSWRVGGLTCPGQICFQHKGRTAAFLPPEMRLPHEFILPLILTEGSLLCKLVRLSALQA